jgi:hypothetical protein
VQRDLGSHCDSVILDQRKEQDPEATADMRLRKVYLVDYSEPHEVDRCTRAMAIEKEQSIATVRW